jgi:hypothetical protein
MTTTRTSHNPVHESTTKTHESTTKGGKPKYEVKPSFADDGTPRFAILRDDAFVEHMASEGQAEAAVKGLEAHDEVEAEAQKVRDQRRDAIKAGGKVGASPYPEVEAQRR